jgi:uncharacterized protein (TIGR00159 family)
MGELALGRELVQAAREVGPSGTLDILLLATAVYLGLAWLRRSRATAAFRGVLVLAAVYLLARQLNLALTAWALEAFFLLLLVAAVVIFRDELRHAVEQLASWRARLRPGAPSAQPADALTALLARTLEDLARSRVGALLVLEGQMAIDGHLEGGVSLDGLPSEPLLHSLFDPHSIGHDGAAVIKAGRLVRFAVHLPLSTNFDELGHRGTRHAAALGLAERTDALCLVSSEERGVVSIAHQGTLRAVEGAELRRVVGDFLRPSKPRPRRWQGVLREAPTVLSALLVAVALWFVLVHGATVTQRTFKIPVQYAELDPQKRVVAIQPPSVTLTFTGTRRDFYFVGPANVKLVVPLGDAKAGSKVVAISPFDVSFPAALTLKTIEPSHLVLRIAPQATADTPR